MSHTVCTSAPTTAARPPAGSSWSWSIVSVSGLLAAIGDGDADALGELFRRVGCPAVNVAWRALRDAGPDEPAVLSFRRRTATAAQPPGTRQQTASSPTPPLSGSWSPDASLSTQPARLRGQSATVVNVQRPPGPTSGIEGDGLMVFAVSGDLDAMAIGDLGAAVRSDPLADRSGAQQHPRSLRDLGQPMRRRVDHPCRH
jgi:hypothetical protein